MIFLIKIRNKTSSILPRHFGNSLLNLKSHRISPFLYHLTHLSTPTLIMIADCGSRNISSRTTDSFPSGAPFSPTRLSSKNFCLMFLLNSHVQCKEQYYTPLVDTGAQLCCTDSSGVLLGTGKQSLRDITYHFVVNNIHEVQSFVCKITIQAA